MEQAIQKDHIDMIGIARPTCIEPNAAAVLLQKRRDRVDFCEAEFVLGGGRQGPNARNWLINLINNIARIEYCIWQMHRMSRGEPPQLKTQANALGFFLWYLARMARLGLQRKLVGTTHE